MPPAHGCSPVGGASLRAQVHTHKVKTPRQTDLLFIHFFLLFSFCLLFSTDLLFPTSSCHSYSLLTIRFPSSPYLPLYLPLPFISLPILLLVCLPLPFVSLPFFLLFYPPLPFVSLPFLLVYLTLPFFSVPLLPVNPPLLLVRFPTFPPPLLPSTSLRLPTFPSRLPFTSLLRSPCLSSSSSSSSSPSLLPFSVLRPFSLPYFRFIPPFLLHFPPCLSFHISFFFLPLFP